MSRPPRSCSNGRKTTAAATHAWRLSASVHPTHAGSRLVMGLHYGGALWGPVIERLLTDEIEGSRPRLLELVSP